MSRNYREWLTFRALPWLNFQALLTLHLVFKIVERLSGNWRALNGGENLMALVLAGCGFEDGILKRGQVYEMAAAAD